MTIHKSRVKFWRQCLKFVLVFILFLFLTNSVKADQITDEISSLQEQIKQQQAEIQKLEEQKKLYQEKINLKRKESVSLKNQISILDNYIAKAKTEIKEKETRIKESELSIKNIQIKIQDQRQKIESRKQQISGLLQLINHYDNKNYLEIILLNSSVSEFLNQIKYVGSLQSSLRENLEKIKLIKDGLEIQEDSLRQQKQELVNLQDELVDRKKEFASQKDAKNKLLTETRGAEWKFQTLLTEAIREQKQTEQEIANAEKTIRAKLSAQKEQEMMEKLDEGEAGPMIFSWPVTEDTVTCNFHDPDYPFRKWLGEHPGIDIRAEQGTAIRAPAAGYVAKAKDAGLGYSYIMLIHNDGFATVFGHVSAIYVKEDAYVRRGDIIGRSGGIPGTAGAGRFSTGPHLHFEVRLNGIPVNPLNYLI